MKKKIALLQGGFNGEVMKYVMHGIQKRMAEECADLYVFNCYGGENEDPLYNQGEYDIFSLINYDDYDGFIMASNNITSGIEREKLRKLLVQSNKPAVSMEHLLEGLHYVGCENYQTVRDMTTHMIQKHGAKKVFYIGGPSDNYESQCRMNGVLDAMTDAHLEMDPSWCRHYNYTYQDGYQAFYDFQDINCGVPDCVIAANDVMAIGYCTAASENNLFAPNDFLIGGFDNSSYSETYEPKLTTVDREKFDAGYHSCDVLFQLIHGENVPVETKLKSNVIYRSSCGCPNHTEQLKFGRQSLIGSVLNQKFLRGEVQKMHKELVLCSDWSEYANQLEKYMPALKCNTMYFMLNRQQYLHPYTENRENPAGYNKKFSILFAWENGERKHYQNQLDGHNLIPTTSSDQLSHVYLILPIHFQEKGIGYCVIQDSLYMVDNQVLFSWSHSINMSTEIILERIALKHANSVLDALSMEDSMTGVYNRIGLTRKAEQILESDRLTRKHTVILFADVNHLKTINDTYGHKSGDFAIITVAKILKKICPDNAVITRYGGDEFVIIVPNCNEKSGELLSKRMHEELKKVNEEQTLSYEISVSIGYVCAHPDDLQSLDEYVKEADQTMYIQKRKRSCI